MIGEMSSHREELRELCHRFHVRRLDLFGSAAGDHFDPARRDLDFLVEFDRGAPGAMSFKTLFGLKETLGGNFLIALLLCFVLIGFLAFLYMIM